MTLTRYRLGDLIEQVNTRNKDVDNRYTVDDVRGISTGKMFIETKANMKNVSLNSYKVVNPNCFAYVADTSRRGDKISLAFNNYSNAFLVSSISTIFQVSNNELLEPVYLFMYFNRSEFDRFSRFNSWGSARETFSWEDFCDIKIDLPPLDIQKKYVAIYKAMLENQAAYEKGLEDLKLVCDGTVENFKKIYNIMDIGKFIIKGIKNSDNEFSKVLGVGGSGFIKPQKKPNKSLKNYKIMKKGAIVYAPPLYNINSNAIQLYDFNSTAVCSPIYEVFYTNKDWLIPEYLILWLKREEFKRYAAFHAGGVRNTFDYSLMKEYSIPIPPIEVQNSIANIYKVYTERKEINEKLKERLKNICPILIKGAVEETKRKEA